MLAIKSCLACLSGRKFKPDLSPPKDVEDLFRKYSENEVMKADHFQRFLAEVQGETKSEVEAEAIMNSHLSEKGTEKGSVWDKFTRPKFYLENFFDYLFSERLNLPLHSKVHHDMNLPMSHYYIFTGHNSYLTGNQLSSDCSEKPIIEALCRGVRVIELDLWPNSSKDNIHVLHGRTLTTPVDFEQCIVAIKDNAFVKSEYPVIITFEDHLPAPLQAKVAEIVNRVLGDTLYYPDSQHEGFTEFPSPESLKNRILISTKPPKEYLATEKDGHGLKATPGGSGEVAKETTPVKEEQPWGDEIPDIAEDFLPADKSFPVSTEPGLEVDMSDEERKSPEKLKDPNMAPEYKSLPVSTEPGLEADMSDEERKSPEKLKDSNMAPEYKRIITIRAGKARGDSLKDALTTGDPFVRRVSLSEPQLSKVAKSHPEAVVSFTSKNILRIYPKGIRVDSSNYNPIKAWAHGAQMVAFNMQGYGRPLWLVHGLFRANGGSGYVRKPDFLIDKSSEGELSRQNSFDPMQPGPVKKILKVKVYQGQGWLERFSKTHFDTFSPPDFYTRVGIAGVKTDTIMKHTETKMDDWTPRWEAEFEFPLRAPELALLRIEVHEYDATGQDDFGGQTCLPVPELRPGIRVIPLFDKKGNELSPVRLLARFDFSA